MQIKDSQIETQGNGEGMKNKGQKTVKKRPT